MRCKWQFFCCQLEVQYWRLMLLMLNFQLTQFCRNKNKIHWDQLLLFCCPLCLHRTKAPDILWGVWQFSGSGCINSGWNMKYTAVFYIPAEYFISSPELAHPEPENCHTPHRKSRALVLCWRLLCVHIWWVVYSHSLFCLCNNQLNWRE